MRVSLIACFAGATWGCQNKRVPITAQQESSHYDNACKLATKVLGDRTQSLEWRLDRLVVLSKEKGLFQEVGELVDYAEGDRDPRAMQECPAIEKAIVLRRSGSDDVITREGDIERDFKMICLEFSRNAGDPTLPPSGRATLRSEEGRTLFDALMSMPATKRSAAFKLATKEVGLTELDCKRLSMLPATSE